MGVATRRMRVWRRDEGRCRFCGVTLTRSEFTLDHLLPRSKGGPDWDINLVVSCSPCNNQKGDKTLEEAGMELIGNQAFRDVWREIQWELAHARTERLFLYWRVIP
jgi:5-methylcytosine-specific restriction endonuclease McrA